jgi:S-DNA-T family DNA segregation ATPase FtsK/SpoIIIE
VAPLPADPHVDLPEGEASEPGESLWLPVGPGGDDGQPVGLDLLRSGGLLVVGPPGSGRTSSLAAFARHCRSAGMPVLHLVPPTRAGSARSSAASDPERRAVAGGPPGDRVSVTDAPALHAWVAASAERPAVVVADDVTALPEPTADVLTTVCGAGGNLIVLAAASAADLAGTFRGPTVALRRNRTVLLLRPAPGDAELLGLRIPRAPLPVRPGAGWLLFGGSVTRVQVARHRGPAGHARGRP